MNIDQYPINFGYLETTTLKGGTLYTHRGNDYPLVYQDVLIEGDKIGVSGESGLAEGPHVHVQAGRDEWAQSTINPTPYVGKPGVVVKTGNGSQWGNYVCVRVGNVNVYYCHLSRIDVKVGQEIKEGKMMIPDNDAWFNRFNKLMVQIRGREITRAEFRKNFVGADPFKMVEILSDHPEADRATASQKVPLTDAEKKLKQIREIVK